MKNNWLIFTLGGVLTAVGLVWLLQGTGVLPGSVMSGDSTWTIIGSIVALVGVALLVWGFLRRRAPRS